MIPPFWDLRNIERVYLFFVLSDLCDIEANMPQRIQTRQLILSVAVLALAQVYEIPYHK